MARSAIDDGLYALNIRLPHAVGTAMGMRNLDAERYALSADITFCHGVCTSFNTCFYLAADNESAIHYLTYSDTTLIF